MRKTTAILLVVLCCSLALNAFSFSRMYVLRKVRGNHLHILVSNTQESLR